MHCADIHLDAPFSSLGGGSEKTALRRQDLKHTFEEIIKRAKAEEVQLLLISGDLYEHNYVSKATINHINDLFAKIPATEILIVPGNHDPYIANSFYKNFKWNENVHLLTDYDSYVTLDEIGVCVYGIGFSNFYQEKSLMYDIKPIDREYINILLAHGTVDMNFKQNLYNPMDSGNLAGIGMDYIGLGHFHNRMDDVGGYGIIYNPGSPEPLGFDETGEHGAFLGTISKTEQYKSKLDIEFIKLGKKFYECLNVDINGCCTDEQMVLRVEEALNNSVNKQAYKLCEGLYSITLKGYVEKGFRVNTSFIQGILKDKVFFIKLKDETNIDYNFDEISREMGLRGLFTRKIYSLMAKTEDEYEKQLLMRALYYGMEALETGKIEIN
jgi:DNA repair protein SbcD/Mre11